MVLSQLRLNHPPNDLGNFDRDDPGSPLEIDAGIMSEQKQSLREMQDDWQIFTL